MECWAYRTDGADDRQALPEQQNRESDHEETPASTCRCGAGRGPVNSPGGLRRRAKLPRRPLPTTVSPDRAALRSRWDTPSAPIDGTAYRGPPPSKRSTTTQV